jgi:hypothetical protein
MMWSAAVRRTGGACVRRAVVLNHSRPQPRTAIANTDFSCAFKSGLGNYVQARCMTVVPDDSTKDERVYESPLSAAVTRLRTVSVVTGVIGSVGLPMFVAMKGGDLPSTGMLAIAMTFVAGSLGSTAAIYFVFSPYVYSIERIPIRKCNYKIKGVEEGEEATSGETPQEPAVVELEEKTENQTEKKDVLLKAITRSLFLRQTEIVFDPLTDVVPYKGYRPLCNFIAKGVPLYVHPEYVHDATLRMHVNVGKAKDKPLDEQNPDDLI